MDLEHEPEHGSASSLDAALQTQDRKKQGVIGSLGSTATGVLNHATCDVLAVRESDGSV
jgi:hypothetical protein